MKITFIPLVLTAAILTCCSPQKNEHSHEGDAHSHGEGTHSHESSKSEENFHQDEYSTDSLSDDQNIRQEVETKP